jgi:hypothetical protein
MKRQLLILIAIIAFATVSTTSSFAQTGRTVKADIKFDFQIGKRIYPAGKYRIELIGDKILRIRSVGGVNKQQLIAAGQSNAGTRQTPKLVFQKYGANYFLTKIFLDTEQWGYSIRPSRRQREAEKNPALASVETLEVDLTK